MSDIVIVASITAIASILATAIAHKKQAAKTEQIHLLVNSRLTMALDEIKRLRAYIERNPNAEESPPDTRKRF